jgi:hypothetical protein
MSAISKWRKWRAAQVVRVEARRPPKHDDLRRHLAAPSSAVVVRASLQAAITALRSWTTSAGISRLTLASRVRGRPVQPSRTVNAVGG